MLSFSTITNSPFSGFIWQALRNKSQLTILLSSLILITLYKVLTAAHCCDGSGADEVTVRAGTALHASGGTVYNVAQVKMHPEYDR